MVMNLTRNDRRHLKKQSAKWPAVMTEIPIEEWPAGVRDIKLFKAWRSNRYLAQAFQEREGIIRLSVNRTVLLPNNEWDDGLSWDELQVVKRQCGFGQALAVEIYPKDIDIVNVANMRHLWILPHGLNFGWKGR
jgi:hypothetical protein